MTSLLIPIRVEVRSKVDELPGSEITSIFKELIGGFWDLTLFSE